MNFLCNHLCSVSQEAGCVASRVAGLFMTVDQKSDSQKEKKNIQFVFLYLERIMFYVSMFKLRIP